MNRRLSDRKGFTLVELMIVVAIIGILAAIAIPNFLRFRLKAKTSEAKANLGAVYKLQTAHYAEFDFYICGQTWTPSHPALSHDIKIPWDPTSRFSIIGFAPEGEVYYEYQLMPLGQLTTPSPLYDNQARGDLDNDGLYHYLALRATDRTIFEWGNKY